MWSKEVLKRAEFAHQFAVDDHREVDVKYHVIVDGKAKNDTNQHELPLVLVRRRIEPERLRLFHVREHTYQRNDSSTSLNQQRDITCFSLGVSSHW